MPDKFAKKLILYLVVFSSLITLVISALQLYFEYERDIDQVESYFKQLELSYLKSIAENVWQEDRARLSLLISGIVEFPGVQYVQVRDSSERLLARVGRIDDNRTLSKSYTLHYHFRGENREIGRIEVVAGLSAIYQRLIERGGIILLSNAVKTLLVVGFLLFLIRLLLTRHLDLMSRYARSLNLTQATEPLQLTRSSFSGKQDELDQLADSLNEMQQTLSKTYNSLKESEERFRQLAENLDEIFWLGSADWKDLIYVNPTFEKYWGSSAEELYAKPKSWLDVILPEDREQVLEDIPRDPSEIEGYVDLREYRILSPTGDLHWIKARAYPIRDAEGQVIRFAGIASDITERKIAEDELKKLSLAIESSPSAVFITDSEGFIEYTNPQFTELNGYTRDESVGRPAEMLSADDPGESSYHQLMQLEDDLNWKGELNHRRKDGACYRARVSLTVVREEGGGVAHFIGIHEDISREHSLSEKLNYQARHDILTGLYNRIEFERRSEELFSASQEQGVEHALCFMDLDQFKVVNDTCGHVAGDELLRQLSRVLQDTVRHSDTLARLGGDEFGVLMEHCSLEQAHRLAEAIRKKVQEYRFAWEEQVFHIGISIGLVAINQNTRSLTELLKQADAACYMAKDLGRNRIHEYHHKDTGLAQRQGEMEWVTRINHALEEDRFRLYSQIIAPLNENAQEHYELLVRMVDEQGEIVPPGAFIPAAERYDLMSKIDEWVIHKAFDLLSSHPDFMERVDFITINLSGASLTSGLFLESIFSNYNQSGIDPGKLCFEVTETVAISNLSAAIMFIKLLKQSGFRFALDDFGSGLSSFGYLKNLPVDFLKIDGMFVRDIVDDPIDYAMVKSINEIGQVMNMQTIAEFVENDEIKSKLIQIGVNFAQGFAIGKPQPFEDLINKSS